MYPVCTEADCGDPVAGYLESEDGPIYLCRGHGYHRMGFVRTGPPATTVPVRSSVIAEADSIINGERQQVYGSAEESFSRIADLFTAMGWRVLQGEAELFTPRHLTAADVALGLMQLKVSRAISSPGHRDSYVDMIGYAALAAELGIDE